MVDLVDEHDVLLHDMDDEAIEDDLHHCGREACAGYEAMGSLVRFGLDRSLVGPPRAP
jgi:hypothetical protein